MPRTTFFIRKNRDKNNTHSLYCRVTYQRTKTEFSTGEKLKPHEWNQQFQKVDTSKRKQQFFETLIETVSYSLKSLALLQRFETAKELVSAYKTPPKKKPSLVSLLNLYIENESSKKSAGTIRNHKIKRDNFEAFCKFTKIEYSADSFNLVEAERFKEWFMQRGSTKRVTTASRHVSFYKQALHHACKVGEIRTFEIINFVGEKDVIREVVFLSMEELEVLRKFKFQSLLLSQIKDLFLFQCYTGLSYGDIWSDWKIKENEFGFILKGSRRKNGQLFFIPIGTEVIDLLKKYNYNLPRCCNEVYNRILKEIGAICEIDKTLTTHVGRKTFATTRDIEGWSRETVSKMLGHRSLKTTELYYLGNSNGRIEQEMQKRKKVPGS